jgi:hypothetical protein
MLKSSNSTNPCNPTVVKMNLGFYPFSLSSENSGKPLEKYEVCPWVLLLERIGRDCKHYFTILTILTISQIGRCI